MRGRGIAVIDVAQTVCVCFDYAPVLRANSGCAFINCDDRCELTVGQPEGSLRRTKLNAITGSEFALLGAEDLNSRKPLRRVIKAPAIIQHHREPPSVRVRTLNHCVSALLYLHPPAAARETHDIADLVVSGVAALRASQIAIHQDRVRYFQRIDQTAFLQRLPDNSVKFPPFLIGRAYHQHTFASRRSGGVFLGDGHVPPGGLRDLLDSPCAVQDTDRLGDLAIRCVINRLAQSRIALAANHVEPGDSHSGLLHLMERPSRLDRVMLALVTDEDDPRNAYVASLMQKTIDLPGPEHARLVNNPQLLAMCLLERVFDEARNGAGGDGRLGERIDGACGRREAMHGIATLLGELANGADRRGLGRAGPALDRGDPIGGRQRYFGRFRLIVKQPSLRGPGTHLRNACDTLRTVLATAHQVEILAFEGDHPGRGIGALRRADFGIYPDQIAGAFPQIRRAPDLLKIGFAHNMLERRRLQRAAVDYRLAFAVVRNAVVERIFDSAVLGHGWRIGDRPLQFDSIVARAFAPFGP